MDNFGSAHALIAAAKRLGATAAGISAAEIDETLVTRMRAAVARGDLATWRYDDEYAQAVCDPQRLLPAARSVICVALAYAHPTPPRARGSGRISNYAWGNDYHGEMRALLDALLLELKALLPDAQAVAVCDTKPLAERAFAVRAGLGWIGKHTNLIIPGTGSFIFLGEIVTDALLEPNRAAKTHCGSCRLCIAQCPTGALRGDYSIDAVRCISDLTQRRDAIPRAMRPLMSDWVWGCDICQEACPPVVRAPRLGHAAFTPPEPAYPDLLELLAMPPAVWRERYGQGAMGWRGASVSRRNAAVALGNNRDRASVPGLTVALHSDGSALVRSHVAWALGRIASPAAFTVLHEAHVQERDAAVREEISAAIDDIVGSKLVHTSMEDQSCV